MTLNNSLDSGEKEAQTNNGEGLSPGRWPVGEQRRPGYHQTTARKERNGQNMTTDLQRVVILKQKRKVKGDIENECTNTG